MTCKKYIIHFCIKFRLEILRSMFRNLHALFIFPKASRERDRDDESHGLLELQYSLISPAGWISIGMRPLLRAALGEVGSSPA